VKAGFARGAVIVVEQIAENATVRHVGIEPDALRLRREIVENNDSALPPGVA
jgi:hypothetical protein